MIVTVYPEGNWPRFYSQVPTPTVTPPIVYVAVRTRNDGKQFAAEIRELRDGRKALLVYTALDRLLSLAGDNQQWVLLRTEKLDALKKHSPSEVVIFDLEIPEVYRQNGAIA